MYDEFNFNSNDRNFFNIMIVGILNINVTSGSVISCKRMNNVTNYYSDSLLKFRSSKITRA
jgi:hypothetical protein